MRAESGATALTSASMRELTYFAAEAVREDLRLFVVAHDADLIGRAAATLAASEDGALDICGSLAVPATFEADDAPVDKLIGRVAEAGANVCVLGLDSATAVRIAQRAAAKGHAMVFVEATAALHALARRRQRRGPSHRLLAMTSAAR
jgi:hypothetical protein